MNIRRMTILCSACFLLIIPSYVNALAGEGKTESFHLGALYPNGVDVAGYTVEKEISNNAYLFYTFGLPSVAALGISYYNNYNGDGFTGTVGVGIGSAAYGSLAYQWKLKERDFLKLGAGVTAGIAYSGLYPVLSFEHRF